jgi:hypothetical protein
MNKILNFLSNYFGAKDISQYPELLESIYSMERPFIVAAPLYTVHLKEIDRQFRKLKLKSI